MAPAADSAWHAPAISKRLRGPRTGHEVIMLTKNILIASCIGLVCVAVAVGIVLFIQRGAHLDLPGTVLKVRTAPLDENSTIAMIDFRVSNPSDYPARVRTVRVYAEAKNGGRLEGTVIADVDSQRVFDALPLLGKKYNPSLVLQDNIPGHATWDRMIGARFDVPESQFQQRQRVIVAIEEIDGNIYEILEGGGK